MHGLRGCGMNTRDEWMGEARPYKDFILPYTTDTTTEKISACHSSK